MIVQNADEIIAVVSPRSVGGESIFEATKPITSETVEDFRSEQDDITSTVKELKNLGFTVHQEGQSTISIGGSRKLFEDVFGAKLKKEKAEIMTGQEIEFFAVPGEPQEQVLQAPGELSDLVEGVALAEPAIFYESPLPPIAPPDPEAYRYLFVPDEVGLLLNANRVHRMGTTGRGIKVAMVDTGFYRHPFYSWHGYRVKSTVLGPGASDPTKDDYSHGTGEAANIFATAPDAELIPVKMGDPVGSFKAAVAKKPHVITNSWGLTYSIDKPPSCSLSAYAAALAAAIANAVSNGIVVCFSGGNGTAQRFPASHPDIISVGGVHVNSPFESIADFEASTYASSFDSCIYSGRHVPDLCGLVGKNSNNTAPLVMLPVQPGSTLDFPNTGSTNDGWGIFSGTSAACPQLAGVVALMLEKDSSLTPAEVKKVLKESATDIKTGSSAMGHPAGAGPDDATGSGLVNAKWSYIRTMGSVAVKFFEASREVQAQMLSEGMVPEVSSEFVDDMIETLRSTR